MSNSTERELEVLKLICEEKTAAEIGKEIFLSPTVSGRHTSATDRKSWCEEYGGAGDVCDQEWYCRLTMFLCFYVVPEIF